MQVSIKSKSEARPSLEQERAADTWRVSKDYKSDHVNFAKGLPALIMNSGLMQVLAFAQDKGKHQKVVVDHLRAWLCKRFTKEDLDFDQFMQVLLNASTADYQAMSNEAFAWLKWLRQMGAARKSEKGDE